MHYGGLKIFLNFKIKKIKKIQSMYKLIFKSKKNINNRFLY